MKHYHVSWQINLEAANPIAAAEQAWAHMRARGSIANCFEVTDRTGHTSKVDLEDVRADNDLDEEDAQLNRDINVLKGRGA